MELFKSCFNQQNLCSIYLFLLLLSVKILGFILNSIYIGSVEMGGFLFPEGTICFYETLKKIEVNLFGALV